MSAGVGDRDPTGFGQSGKLRIPHMPIRARLILLSLSLLGILAVLSAVLTHELARGSQGLADEASLVSTVRNANIASKHIGDLKYWLTNFAVTQLAQSQQKADAAKAAIDKDLKAIAVVDPDGVAAIGREIGAMTGLADKAADAYSSDDSAAGNALMAQSQAHVMTVDREIGNIVDRLEKQALARRDAAMAEARGAVRLSVTLGIVALTVAVGLTGYIVRSINAPLKRLETSIAAITRGDLDAPLPPAAGDEIGAMTRTLGMLRDSLIERDRLERERREAEAEVRRARDAAEAALKELQTAQASLLHAQKMAALGQLTAGIAHEIKNPLNFVNNFADLSVELLDELRQTTAPAIAGLDEDARAQLDDTVEMLAGNLGKIAEHGRRADGIVKSMLAHSRGTSGERQPADVNALVEEALNLAYHGARAQDQSFNITMERDLDPALAPLEVVAQDLTRVFLNLFGNGFYAAHKKGREADRGFRPVLRVATRELGEAVEIRVRDNGTGIPAEHRDKLFQPFFTTKPTGEGTGLGLSISWDIVTQQHGGTMMVDSEPGQFTEFTVRLPRRRASAGAGRAA